MHKTNGMTLYIGIFMDKTEIFLLQFNENMVLLLIFKIDYFENTIFEITLRVLFSRSFHFALQRSRPCVSIFFLKNLINSILLFNNINAMWFHLIFLITHMHFIFISFQMALYTAVCKKCNIMKKSSELNEI